MTQRLHRDRSLPEGYQYGDAQPWRAPHLNAADRLARHGSEQCQLRGVCDGRQIRWDGAIPLCAKCGANWISGRGGKFDDRLTANVIEGEHFDSDEERHRTAEGAR